MSESENKGNESRLKGTTLCPVSTKQKGTINEEEEKNKKERERRRDTDNFR